MIRLNISLDEFASKMETDGWIIFEGLIDRDFTTRMIAEMEAAYKVCRSIQIKNRVEKETEYTLHHLIGQGETFLEFLDLIEPLEPYFNAYFEGKFILNSFGGAINTAHSRSYAHRIHRDIRTFSGSLPIMLNTLFMLDDFTELNGATYLLPGSHKEMEKPSNEVFEANKVQALAPAGSLLVFNSNVWHRGDDNRTDYSRRSVTPMFCRPFVKPQYDYARFLGYDQVEKMSEFRKQVLGFYSRIPENLDQWYQPPENRMYRPGQG